MIRFSAGFGGALAVFIALATYGPSKSEPSKQAESEMGLGYVHFVGLPPVIKQLQAAAASVGWTDAKLEPDGSLLIKVPIGYNADRFGELLHAIESVQSRNFGMQLLLRDGSVIDSDGNKAARN